LEETKVRRKPVLHTKLITQFLKAASETLKRCLLTWHLHEAIHLKVKKKSASLQDAISRATA
jgi:hypothetical protein